MLDFNFVNELNINDIKNLLEELRTSFSDRKYIFSNFTADNFISKAKIHRPKETHLQIMYDFLAVNALKAERQSPGAGRLAVEMCARLLEKNKLNISNDSYFLNKLEIFSHLNSATNSTEITELVRLITDFAGLGARISCESANVKTPIVELCEGYTFKLASPLEFKTPWKKTGVHILLIDGFIETVSEIHHILMQYSSPVQPLVIMARNISADVVNTISVNNARNTLELILVTVPLELDSVNTLLDISVICGSDVISSEKGQLISAVQKNKISVVDSVTYESGMLTITNANRKNIIDQHVSDLKVRADESAPEKKELLNNRIKSLSSCTVSVRFPRELKYEYFDAKLDHALRLFSELVKMKVTKYDEKIYTTKCLLIAEKFAKSMVDYSNNIEIAISK